MVRPNSIAVYRNGSDLGIMELQVLVWQRRLWIEIEHLDYNDDYLNLHNALMSL